MRDVPQFLTFENATRAGMVNVVSSKSGGYYTPNDSSPDNEKSLINNINCLQS